MLFSSFLLSFLECFYYNQTYASHGNGSLSEDVVLSSICVATANFLLVSSGYVLYSFFRWNLLLVCDCVVVTVVAAAVDDVALLLESKLTAR